MTKLETTKGDLPGGWRRVKLGEVCEINPHRNNLSRSDHEPTSFVPMEAVDDEKGIIREIRERPFVDVKKGYTYFEEGDVLFAKITPCMQNGKHAIARNLIGGIGFASTEFHVIRPTNGILAEWIHYFVRQPVVLQDATHHFTGAVGQQRVPADFLKSIEIPFPPLDEQRRITAILRDQMASVEKARVAAQARLEAVKALPAALLRQVFPKTGHSLPTGWQWVSLKDKASLLPSKSIASDGDCQVQAVTTACLTESNFNPEGIKSARMWARDALECLLGPGEVLIARSNTPDLVGRACIYEGTPPGIVASDLTIRIQTNRDLSPYFLSRYLSFLFIGGFWREQAGGASGTMKKITRTQVLDLAIPFPPLPEQQSMVELLKNQMAAVDRARSAAESELQTINALPSALLRRAFNGDL